MIKQVEVNIDYILMLVAKYQKTHYKDKEILTTIEKSMSARLERRSISDLTREIIDRYLAEREEMRHQSQMEALDRARKLREQIREEHGGQPLDIDVVDMIHRMREERDEQILRAGSG